MRTIAWCALAGCVLMPSTATAQQAVSESEFLDGVGPDHPASLAIGGDLARAEAARRRAAALANPRLEFSREHPEDAPRQDTWSFAWTPPIDGRRGLARDAAEAGVLAARERAASGRAGLRRDLRKAYADWSLAHARRELLTAQLASVQDLADVARLRMQAGEESGLGAGRLALAAQELRAQLVGARTEHLRAEAVALAFRGDLAGRSPALPTLPPPPAGLDATRQPELRALQHEARQAALESRLSGRFWTVPELQAGWQRLELAGRSQGGPVLGVAWTLPLFDRNQGGRHEMARRKEIAEARVALASARAERELDAALQAYALAAAAAEESANAATAAERLVDSATASYRAGEATLTDLLDTLRAVREARIGALELLGAALEAQRELEPWAPPSSPEGAQR
jgi:outer membrane protein TolC